MRYADLGPRDPGPHGTLGGVDIALARPMPKRAISGLGSGPGASPVRSRPTDKERARAAHERFLAAHSTCDCHELYGGQPRPIGWRERERDRNRLRRERNAR